VTKAKKVSGEEKWPVDSDSSEPIKQPYVGGFSRSICGGEFSIPKLPSITQELPRITEITRQLTRIT